MLTVVPPNCSAPWYAVIEKLPPPALLRIEKPISATSATAKAAAIQGPRRAFGRRRSRNGCLP